MYKKQDSDIKKFYGSNFNDGTRLNLVQFFYVIFEKFLAPRGETIYGLLHQEEYRKMTTRFTHMFSSQHPFILKSSLLRGEKVNK